MRKNLAKLQITLRNAMARTSPTGINLKEVANAATPYEIEFIAFTSWLNICGLKPFATANKTYAAAPVGFAPFLRKDPGLYINLEQTFREQILEWRPEAAKATLVWLNAKPNIVQAVTLNSGKTHFARSITPKPGRIVLKHCVATQYKPKLLDIAVDPTHPLAHLLSGYSTAEPQEIEIPNQDLKNIAPEDPAHWRISISHPLWSVANAMLANTYAHTNADTT